MKRTNRPSRTQYPGAECLANEGPKRKVPKTCSFDVPQCILQQQHFESHLAATRNVVAASRPLKTKSRDSSHLLPETKRVVSCTVVSGECDSPPPLEIFQLPVQVASVAHEPSAATATSYIATSQGPAHTVTSADSAGAHFANKVAYFAPLEQSTTYFGPQRPKSAVPLRPAPEAYLSSPQTPKYFETPQEPTNTFTTQPTLSAVPYFAATQYTATSSHVAAPENNTTGKKTKTEPKKSCVYNPSLEFEQIENEVSNVTDVHYDEFDIDNCNEDSLGIEEVVNAEEADVSLIVDFALGTNNRKTSELENQELDFAFDGI